MTKERAVAVALVGAGAWQCIAQGEAINADGISYLDMARQFASGDASPIANGYWSPVYPMILALGMRLFGWMGVREVSIAYGINIALMLLAALAFGSLLQAVIPSEARNLLQAVIPSEARNLQFHPRRFGDRWTLAAAWALFGWMVVRMISVASITPDMLVAAHLFCASAMIARRLRGELTQREVLLFGVVVASAYWTKAVMFPAGIALLLAYAFASRRPREIAVAFAAFGVVASPLVMAQSQAAGRFSTGETGRLNYAWYVNGVSREGAEHRADDAVVVNRAAIALTSVAGAKLYADSMPGTFPYWYDPAYWNPGSHPTWNAGQQMAVLRVTGRWYRTVLWIPFLLVLGFVVLAMAAQRRPKWSLWPLLWGPVALMTMYALIHVEGRLVGASLIVAFVVLLAMADADEKVQSHSREWLLAALAAFCVWEAGARLVRGPRLGESRDASGVAAALHAAGVARGSDVAVIGTSPLDMGAYWAHVAGVQIVATIPPSELSRETMAAVAAESCAHGRALRAFVGRDSSWAQASGGVGLGDGWFTWRTADDCTTRRQ